MNFLPAALVVGKIVDEIGLRRSVGGAWQLLVGGGLSHRVDRSFLRLRLEDLNGLGRRARDGPSSVAV